MSIRASPSPRRSGGHGRKIQHHQQSHPCHTIQESDDASENRGDFVLLVLLLTLTYIVSKPAYIKNFAWVGVEYIIFHGWKMDVMSWLLTKPITLILSLNEKIKCNITFKPLVKWKTGKAHLCIKTAQTENNGPEFLNWS